LRYSSNLFCRYIGRDSAYYQSSYQKGNGLVLRNNGPMLGQLTE